VDAQQLADRIHHILTTYEPPEGHLISNYVQPATNIRAVRIDGEFDLYSLAYVILDFVEWED
jgi:hypothetical protein